MPIHVFFALAKIASVSKCRSNIYFYIFILIDDYAIIVSIIFQLIFLIHQLVVVVFLLSAVALLLHL